MRRNFILLLLLCCLQLTAQKRFPPEQGVHFLPDSSKYSDDPEKRHVYGLYVTPPWPDGGSFYINLPEHLWYMPDTKGIARHHDKRKNVWKFSRDRTTAGYDVESILEPGIFLSVKARATNDRVNFEMTITNHSAILLKSIGPLFCFQYHHLKGFPAKETDNFAHTFVIVEGKPVCLKDLPVKTPEAIARMAQVKDCKDESNWWAEKMGGMIDQRIDMALTALTSSGDDRKVIVSWTPGKSMLSNIFIPCIHADPCIGDLAPGESTTLHGVLIFTRNSIESVIQELSKPATATTTDK